VCVCVCGVCVCVCVCGVVCVCVCVVCVWVSVCVCVKKSNEIQNAIFASSLGKPTPAQMGNCCRQQKLVNSSVSHTVSVWNCQLAGAQHQKGNQMLHAYTKHITLLCDICMQEYTRYIIPDNNTMLHHNTTPGNTAVLHCVAH